MFDGALSFLAMIAAQTLADGVTPRRGLLPLSGQFACYRPYECKDGGWVACGALEPKFWQAWCRGAGREDLIEQQFAAPGSDGAPRRRGRPSASARAREWEAFAAEHDCCVEPVLDLPEALESELVRAREMVVELDQPGAPRPSSCSACRSSSTARPATRRARPVRRSASTPTRCSRPPATAPTRSRR